MLLCISKNLIYEQLQKVEMKKILTENVKLLKGIKLLSHLKRNLVAH